MIVSINTITDTYVIQVIITPAKDTKPNNLLVGQLAVVNCMNVLNTDIGPDMSALHKEWYHNNEIITTDIRQRGNILQLQLKKVKTSFAGYYECVTFIDDNTRRNESDNILLYVNCECVCSSKCFKLITVGCDKYMIIQVMIKSDHLILIYNQYIVL